MISMTRIRIALIASGLLCIVFADDKWGSMQDTRLEKCTYKLWKSSQAYFESRLIALTPNFIQFSLRLNVAPHSVSPTLLLPLNWVWTYSSPSVSYPYLSWNIDHGLLSFGLLDIKTHVIDYVQINASESCHINLGSNETTWKIVEALKNLVVNMSKGIYHTYEQTYFCYLEEVPGIRETFQYKAALYFNYPISYINYKCCLLDFTYHTRQYVQTCPTEQHKKWEQCRLGPFILGLIIFLYFPIMLFEISAWLAKGEVIRRQEYECTGEYENINAGDDEDWIYLDGKPPITLLESLNVLSGYKGRHPVLFSRIRRLICVLIIPFVIYIQIGMYSGGIGAGKNITVAELVSHGTPMGFLSLLGNEEDRNKVFVPLLGGPMCVLIIYYGLGIVLMVFPRSLKQIVERGIPQGNTSSPLFLGINDIIKLAMLKITPDPGYEKGAVVCKCSIYMLFSKAFWKRTFEIQQHRFPLQFDGQSSITYAAKLVLLPLYIAFCLAEIVVCVIFYSIPTFGFVSIMVKGAIKSILMFRLENRIMFAIFKNPLAILIGTISVFGLFVFYFYSLCLIFIESFSFISQIIIFCLVAVIVYPSSSFGYLFFFMVLLYYLIRLIKDFGDIYLSLLSAAVEKSRELYSQVNYMTVCDEQILLNNVRATRVQRIRINETWLDVPQNVLHRNETDSGAGKLSEHKNMFGIPRSLFAYLVGTHRPIHIEVLKLLFHLSLIVFLISMTLSINSKFATGSSTEISEVMHVIFIITIGAMPRVLEIFLMNSSETVKREIEMRNIEESIKEFWILRADGGFVLEP